MWEQIFNLAISNGLFAVLFLGLFIYQLRDSRTREQKYQETIEKLGSSLEIVKHVKEDVDPFIWAILLDGNPCSVNLMNEISRPCLYQGSYLDEYLKYRPIIKPE